MQYQVLARKYRPQTLEHLRGQDIFVRSFHHAVVMQRLSQSFLLTGIRGIGKTSAARIMAKAFNCIGLDEAQQAPSPPCGQCRHCLAIERGQHPDVLEMDAATHTSVTDIRQILESSIYAPTLGRMRLFIIDEVHMLSTSAFNALLKTLEEPPKHVVFILATTDIHKVPVTILSRCQRFDLRRIDHAVLSSHLAEVIATEGWTVDQDGLDLLAQAADGSFRDGLTLLDQWMTLAPVAADGSEGRHLPTTSLLSMLGRMDQTQVLGWVKQILSGDPVGAIEQLRIFYAHGSDPTVLLSLLLQWLHRLALATLDRSLLTGLDAASQDTVMEWSQSLDMPSVTRMWQIGLQGLEEISAAPSAIEALEMIVLRMIYMQRLPVPLELLKWAAGNASGGGTHGPSLGRGSAPSKPSHTMASAQALTPANTETSEKIAPLLVLRSASEVVNACLIHDAMLLHYWLYHDIIITSCTEGVLRWTAIDPEAGAHNASMAQKLRQWLNAKTGRVWDVQQEAAPLATLPPSLAAKKQAREEQEETAWRHHPLVQHSYSLFPNARWVGLEMSQDAIEPWLVTHSEPSVDSMLN